MNNQELEQLPNKAVDTAYQDTQFATQAAGQLMAIVRKNGWARKLGGQSEHLQFEAWQTVGKYYGYTVKTMDSNYVEFGNVKGFEARAVVIDNKTGLEIGGAEAACLSDEPNWKSKPLFQLKSMAQTRAGSKALRQILGFVVALAGFSPTPAEEMDPDFVKNDSYLRETKPTRNVMSEEETREVFGEVVDTCSACDAKVSPKVMEFSVKKFNKILCMDCQKAQ